MYAGFFEEIRVGEQAVLGSHTFTAAEIKAFAARFDPQPFHMDEAKGRASHFGALCASGWHTAAICQRLAVAHRAALVAEMDGTGRAVAELGPSPGFRELKWLRPVCAGDTIAYTSRVIEKTELPSRPAWGLVTSLVEGRNQHGERAFAYNGELYLQRQVG
jgi:acyl dehydratase